MMMPRLQELQDEINAAEDLSQEDQERVYGTRGLGLLKAEAARLRWNDASAYYANIYEIWRECIDRDMCITELFSEARESMDNALATYQEAHQAAK